MENNEQINDLVEMVTFLKDNAVTKTEFNGLRSEFSELKDRVGRIESNMVTKDYLDNKLSDLRGDLVVMTRKEDGKVRALIDLLVKKNLVDNAEAEEIKHMEPFPIL
jgi:hypothetical protein